MVGWCDGWGAGDPVSVIASYAEPRARQARQSTRGARANPVIARKRSDRVNRPRRGNFLGPGQLPPARRDHSRRASFAGAPRQRGPRAAAGPSQHDRSRDANLLASVTSARLFASRVARRAIYYLGMPAAVGEPIPVPDSLFDKRVATQRKPSLGARAQCPAHGEESASVASRESRQVTSNSVADAGHGGEPVCGGASQPLDVAHGGLAE
jgi:hypothetical protein